MFCENCGAPIDNARFCPNCGSPASAVNPEQPAAEPVTAPYRPEAPAEQPVYYANAGTYAAAGSPLAGGPANTVLETVRRFATSKLFVIASALLAAATLLSLIGQLVSPGFSVSSDAEGSELLSTLLYCLPSLLILVGLAICIYSAYNRSKPMTTGGLTLIKVIYIIVVVALIILALCMIVFAVLSLVAASKVEELIDFSELENNEYTKEFMSFLEELNLVSFDKLMRVIAVIFFVLAGICIFAVVVTFRLIHTINVAKETIRTGIANSRISGLFAGCCYVIGVLSILGFASIVTENANVWNAIAALLSGASTICFASLQFQYRKAMRALE